MIDWPSRPKGEMCRISQWEKGFSLHPSRSKKEGEIVLYSTYSKLCTPKKKKECSVRPKPNQSKDMLEIASFIDFFINLVLHC